MNVTREWLEHNKRWDDATELVGPIVIFCSLLFKAAHHLKIPAS